MQGPRLRIHLLASGSKGNAAIIEGPDEALLIDDGITKRQFMEACQLQGFDPSRIAAVLITHEHGDHVKGLGVLLRELARRGLEPPTILCTKACHAAARPLHELGVSAPLRLVNAHEDLSIGSLRIQLFPTSHDAADPIACAVEIGTGSDLDRAGWITDTGFVSEEALAACEGARLLAIESNHDRELLANGPYPYVLKRRISSDQGHLSNDQAAEALSRLLSARLEAVVAIHLSETNNSPDLACSSLRTRLSQEGHGAQVLHGSQSRPLSLG